MKIEAFKDKLGSEWTKLFTPFITSPKMDDIYKRLREDVAKKKTIYPDSPNTFKAFSSVAPKDVRLIIISMEPYAGFDYKTGIPQANGLLLDCSNSPTGKLQPSLVSFWEGIVYEYGLDKNDYLTPSLSHLTEQGVLLLNRSLTVVKGQITSHIGVWDEFIKFFFEDVMREFPNIPILILGKDAEYCKRWIFEMTHPIFILAHPSFAARIGETWETDKTFQKINKYIENTHGREKIINWGYKMWEAKKKGEVHELADEDGCPF